MFNKCCGFVSGGRHCRLFAPGVTVAFFVESDVTFENVGEAVGGGDDCCDWWEEDVSVRSRFRRERLGVNLHRDWAFRPAHGQRLGLFFRLFH